MDEAKAKFLREVEKARLDIRRGKRKKEIEEAKRKEQDYDDFKRGTIARVIRRMKK